MNNIVLTYRHEGRDEYLPLIDIVKENVNKWGYDFLTSEYGDLKIPLMLWILHSQRMYLKSPLFDKPSIFFSPDALIIKKLVFPDCDLAVTLNYLQPVKHMLNNGVIFVRPEKKRELIALWDDAIKICSTYPPGTQEWGGDQMALQEALIAKDWRPYGLDVMLLNCNEYNAAMTKNNPEEDERVLEKAKIIHFKGERKKKMTTIWNELKDTIYG